MATVERGRKGKRKDEREGPRKERKGEGRKIMEGRGQGKREGREHSGHSLHFLAPSLLSMPECTDLVLDIIYLYEINIKKNNIEIVS